MNLLCIKNVKELGKAWNETWESMQLVFPINEKYGSCLDELLVGISGPYTLQKILAKGTESPYEIHLHVDREQQTIRAVNHENDDSELEYDEVPS